MRRITEHGTMWAGLWVSLAVHATLLLVLRNLHASEMRAEVAAGEPVYEIQLDRFASPEPVEAAPSPPPAPIPVPSSPAIEPETAKPTLAAVPSTPPPEPPPVVEAPAQILATQTTPEAKPAPTAAEPAPPAVAHRTSAPMVAPMPASPPLTSPGMETPTTTAVRLRAPIQPAYPFRSRLRGEEGEVTLTIEVQADGHARSVMVVQSSGHERLDAAAVAAARDAEYVPARRGVVAMDGRMELRFRFVLTSDRETDRGGEPRETASL